MNEVYNFIHDINRSEILLFHEFGSSEVKREVGTEFSPNLGLTNT